MSEAFETHKARRISEIREKIRISKIRKNVEIRPFGQSVEKAWKKYQWNKAKLKDLESVAPSFLILDLMERKTNEKMRNNDLFNDWMNDFELPQNNERQKKITLLQTTTINERNWKRFFLLWNVF